MAIQQLSFGWPDWSLDPERAKQHARQVEDGRRRALWRRGRHGEVSPPLCWLCPWIHAPAAICKSSLCSLWVDGHPPQSCAREEHVYWHAIDTCPWCGGPAYVGRRWHDEWVENSGTIYVLPACFGPRRYVCARCWHENQDIAYVSRHAHTLCALCPMAPECAQAFE